MKRQDAVHPGEVDDDTARDGNGVAFDTCPRAPAHQGDAPFVGITGDGAHLCRRLRPDHQIWQDGGVRGGIVAVMLAVALSSGDAIGADEGLEIGDKAHG